MKTKIILSQIILLICCSVVLAQTDGSNKGLVLRGDIFDGSSVGDISIDLKLELTNTGKDPIILILPYLEFHRWQGKASWSGYTGVGDKFGFTKFTREDEIKNPDKLKELAKSLDREKPPQNLTYILEPGESLEFRDTFKVKVDNKENYFGVIDGVVEYKISLTKYHNDPDLLEKLQKRWRKFGYLPLNQNGEFSITSEKLK